MKTTILCSTLIFIQLTCYCQSYLGWVTKQVNFRQGPGMENEIISSLASGTQIFVVSLVPENDFYNIIDIATDTEGYVHKSFVKLGEKVKINEEGIFYPSGNSSIYDTQIEIFNNTSRKLTLKLNTQMHSFSAQEKKRITITPGKYNYRASAPGVIPNIGLENLEKNMVYTWEFYIVIN